MKEKIITTNGWLEYDTHQLGVRQRLRLAWQLLLGRSVSLRFQELRVIRHDYDEPEDE